MFLHYKTYEYICRVLPLYYTLDYFISNKDQDVLSPYHSGHSLIVLFPLAQGSLIHQVEHKGGSRLKASEIDQSTHWPNGAEPRLSALAYRRGETAAASGRVMALPLSVRYISAHLTTPLPSVWCGFTASLKTAAKRDRVAVLPAPYMPRALQECPRIDDWLIRNGNNDASAFSYD